jgi:IS5 family transposase
VLFGERLQKAGLIAREGSIVDATFVEAPRQRNTRKENDQLKNDEIPQDWSEKKLSHKDVDAKWTKKNNENYFGYKNHVKIDSKSKLIIDFQTTAAQVHDGEMLEGLLDDMDKGKTIYGDSAYRSLEKEEMLKAKGIISHIHEKGSRNHPLTKEQKDSNREKSKIRARGEHPFAWMHRNCQQLMVRTVGLGRATAKITLLNLLYNMSRAIQIITNNGKGLSTI